MTIPLKTPPKPGELWEFIALKIEGFPYYIDVLEKALGKSLAKGDILLITTVSINDVLHGTDLWDVQFLVGETHCEEQRIAMNEWYELYKKIR